MQVGLGEPDFAVILAAAVVSPAQESQGAISVNIAHQQEKNNCIHYSYDDSYNIKMQIILHLAIIREIIKHIPHFNIFCTSSCL